ncbi:hypothetical protein Xkoz_00002 [Xenorhabdus kozodoii]|uniref:Uncharacterized protein n=1 Tax=Xenorhabdus kozodoii TaxID=351676 RepID=A0A2D0LGZ7_9GAMM|nr:hypothetical protein Xkoz_00002 [Xenorhabdus kozodoii]
MWCSARFYWGVYRVASVLPPYSACLSIPYLSAFGYRSAPLSRPYRKPIVNSANYLITSKPHWPLPSVAVAFRHPCRCLTACSTSAIAHHAKDRKRPRWCGKGCRSSVVKNAATIRCRWMSTILTMDLRSPHNAASRLIRLASMPIWISRCKNLSPPCGTHRSSRLHRSISCLQQSVSGYWKHLTIPPANFRQRG